MQNSKLQKLWEGDSSLTCLKEMDMEGSKDLKEMPDLSRATNLKNLGLRGCSSLVELPSSIRNLNKLTQLDMCACTNLETLPTGMNLEFLNRLNLDGCSRLRTFPVISRNISELILTKTSIEEFPSNFHFENITLLSMNDIKSEKLWAGEQPLAPLMSMLSPSLRILSLSDIPTLVELPYSFQSLHNLTNLSITNCTNMESLTTNINLESLISLTLSGCSQLRSFPNISRNVLDLNLSQTAIEEIPWWIENFSKLKYLFMENCSKLKYVSFSTLKHLKVVDLSNCEALIGAGWNGYASDVEMKEDNIDTETPAPVEASSSLLDNFVPQVMFRLINCFNLDLEAILQHQSVFEQLILSSEEVPSYFTHKATGTSSSLTIPLLQTSLSQPFFRLRACAVIVFDPIPTFGAVGVYNKVNCRFTDRLGNRFDCPCHKENLTAYKKGSHLFIFDYCFPINKDIAHLAKLNCDHVDIQFHFSPDVPCKLKEWGIRLLEDYSSAENRHVCEVVEDNMVYETGDGHGEECEVQGRSTSTRVAFFFSIVVLFFAFIIHYRYISPK